MSWRIGSSIFLEIWPTIESKIKTKKQLNQFGEELLVLFRKHDVDLDDLLGTHKTLDKLLGRKFNISRHVEDEVGYTGLDNNQTNLMRAAKNIAEKLAIDFNEDEDCVWFGGRLEGGDSTVVLQLYNWANKQYSLILSIEAPRFLDDGSVEILHKELRSTVTEKLDVEHLTLTAIDLLKGASSADFDKVIPLTSTSKAEYLEAISHKPIIKIDIGS